MPHQGFQQQAADKSYDQAQGPSMEQQQNANHPNMVLSNNFANA
jgi:hypothetical protein